MEILYLLYTVNTHDFDLYCIIIYLFRTSKIKYIFVQLLLLTYGILEWLNWFEIHNKCTCDYIIKKYDDDDDNINKFLRHAKVMVNLFKLTHGGFEGFSTNKYYYGQYEKVYTIYTSVSEKIGLVYCLVKKIIKHRDQKKVYYYYTCVAL